MPREWPQKLIEQTFCWRRINFNKGGTFLCRLYYETLLLSQGVVLVMETDSGSESSDFIEEDTEESSTRICSDYDTDSDTDLENSGYVVAINPVNQASPTDDADENDYV